MGCHEIGVAENCQEPQSLSSLKIPSSLDHIMSETLGAWNPQFSLPSVTLGSSCSQRELPLFLGPRRWSC